MQLEFGKLKFGKLDFTVCYEPRKDPGARGALADMGVAWASAGLDNGR